MPVEPPGPIAASYFTVSPGGQARMTEAGRAEVERLLLAGDSNTTIIAAVGCSEVTIHKAKLALKAAGKLA